MGRQAGKVTGGAVQNGSAGFRLGGGSSNLATGTEAPCSGARHRTAVRVGAPRGMFK